MPALEKKMQVARAACEMLRGEEVIGIGSGSTVACFIDILAERDDAPAVVPASEASAARARDAGLKVSELNNVGSLRIYVDGADEATVHRSLVKGGGGALAREKVIAAASRQFICIVDDSKIVDVLGREFAVPVEVLPMARSYIARQLVAMGGIPELRQGYMTDNSNEIIDVRGLRVLDPVRTERELNQVAGVVCNGLFACRPADILLIADGSEVRTIGE